MSPREIIILVLGLAIIAVVLRGLFVALRARKGQIRLAIDKNIPTDIDLDALEMAELPSGGARVVARSLDSVNSQNSKLDAAIKRSKDLQLGDSESEEVNVPILMDAVSLPNTQTRRASIHKGSAAYSRQSAPAQHEQTPSDFLEQTELGHESSAEELDELSLTRQETHEPQLGELNAQEVDERDHQDDDEIWENHGHSEVDEDADDVLLDYEDYSDGDEGPGDSLAALAPDYASDDNVEDKAEDVDLEQEIDDPAEIDEELEPAMSEQEPDVANEAEEPRYTAKSFEEQLDDFSLSAGERIGFNETDTARSIGAEKRPQETASQPSLFDDVDDLPEEGDGPNTKVNSLFAAFKRSISSQEKPKEPPTNPQPIKSTKDEAAPRVDVKPAQQPIEAVVPKHEQPSSSPIKSNQIASSRAQADYEAEANAGPSEVLVINVMAKDGYAFAGDDLLQVLITAGLKFGEMNIFHQRVGADKKGPVLFSVANVLNPGTFDLNTMENFSTLGVSFFLALPTVMNNLEAFEKMLAVAQQVKNNLGGELKDDNRNVMTSQTIEHYRQRVRDFELRRLKAAGKKS